MVTRVQPAVLRCCFRAADHMEIEFCEGEDKMKKFVSLLLVLGLSATLLAGCGGKKEEAPAETPNAPEASAPLTRATPS